MLKPGLKQVFVELETDLRLQLLDLLEPSLEITHCFQYEAH